MAILFESSFDNPEDWREALAKALPGENLIEGAAAVTDPKAITYAMVWAPAPGLLKTYPNLKLVCNLGAGVDKVLSDPDYPRHVPLARLIDPALTQGMAEFVVHRVLTFFRGFHLFDQQQRQRTWGWQPPKLARDCRVGVMGLGELGAITARRLAQMDFDLAGWSRSLKEIHRVDSFIGDDKLPAFLRRTDILVNLLPLTAKTENILRAELFQQLPTGAYVINAGRGEHVVDQDLLAALDSGQLAGAALDAFRTEPLPQDHPFWPHPKILVTPHIASVTNPVTAAQELAKVMADLERGIDPDDIPAIVNLDQGY